MKKQVRLCARELEAFRNSCRAPPPTESAREVNVEFPASFAPNISAFQTMAVFRQELCKLGNRTTGTGAAGCSSCSGVVNPRVEDDRGKCPCVAGVDSGLTSDSGGLLRSCFCWLPESDGLCMSDASQLTHSRARQARHAPSLFV